MITLKPVNIKRFELVKSAYVETMVDYLQPITNKPRSVVEEFFVRGVNKMIGRKWDLRQQHFREMYLMPENKKIGMLWYRTHVEALFSDVVVLQWVGTEVKSDLRKYAKDIVNALCQELEAMEINRIAVETYGEKDALNGLWEEMGFYPVREIMNKTLR